MRAVLLYVGEKSGDLDHKLAEFVSLVDMAGHSVVGAVTQFREPDPNIYVGPGKLRELRSMVKEGGVELVVAYHQLKPIQLFNLAKELGVTVMDRIMVILEIFEKRAGTREAKLQIELARHRYMVPFFREYIRRAKMGEQIGFMGAGEYAVESRYRFIRRRISTIVNELDHLRDRRKALIDRRHGSGLPSIVLTGYTSAGKTTIFNALAGEDKFIDGRPFATLDTYSRLVVIYGKKAILTDTIGFIGDLPPLLVDAFYSTLEEVIRASIVLFVVDIGEPWDEFVRKFESSLDVFVEMGVQFKRIVPVANKIDLASLSELRSRLSYIRKYFPFVVPISAARGTNMDKLKTVLFRHIPGYTLLRLERAVNVGYPVVKLNGSHVLVVPNQEVRRAVELLEGMGMGYEVVQQ